MARILLGADACLMAAAVMLGAFARTSSGDRAAVSTAATGVTTGFHLSNKAGSRPVSVVGVEFSLGSSESGDDVVSGSAACAAAAVNDGRDNDSLCFSFFGCRDESRRRVVSWPDVSLPFGSRILGDVAVELSDGAGEASEFARASEGAGSSDAGLGVESDPGGPDDELLMPLVGSGSAATTPHPNPNASVAPIAAAARVNPIRPALMSVVPSAAWGFARSGARHLRRHSVGALSRPRWRTRGTCTFRCPRGRRGWPPARPVATSP